MPNLPKVVRERLQALDQAAASHLDPDVLTAFTERTLTDSERGTVLQHLSRCAECRDVVALALPVSETLQPAMHVGRTSGLAWPSFRWAFVSAGLAVIAFFAFLQFGHHDKSERMAKNAPVAAAVQARNESVPGPESPQPSKATAGQASQSLDSGNRNALVVLKDEKHQSAPPTAEPKLAKDFSHRTVTGTVALPLTSNLQAKQQSVPPPSMAQVGANQTVEVQTLANQAESETEDPVIAVNQPAVPSTAADTEVSRAKSAMAARAPSPTPPSPASVQGRSFQALSTLAAAWTISSGRLQRSLNGGLTWQDINVNASADAGASLGISAASEKPAKRDKKSQFASPVFRAVTANGPDVWAGGTAATLYHSADAGAHWLRVVPSSTTATLTGDIVSLEFPDPQNGTVSTSTGEVWTTADNGQTWRKQ